MREDKFDYLCEIGFWFRYFVEIDSFIFLYWSMGSVAVTMKVCMSSLFSSFPPMEECEQQSFPLATTTILIVAKLTHTIVT